MRETTKIRAITMPKKDRKGNKREMIPLEKAVTLRWGKSQGEKLKEKREEKGLSMERLSVQLKEYGINCVPSNLVKLEKGEAQSIKTETLLALISLLDMDILDF
jgi:DNA-binding Xre family transcriptional regulator